MIRGNVLFLYRFSKIEGDKVNIMFRIILTFGLSCLLLVTNSCQNSYSLKGSADVSNIEGRMITLALPNPNGSWEMLDSCEVTHGLFSMKGKTDSVSVATLFVGDTPLMPVILEKGNICVDISNLSLRVSGTRLNDLLYKFIDDKTQLDVKATELDRTESQMIMRGEEENVIRHYVDSAYASISDEMTKLVTGFISSNYSNVLALCGFNMLTNGLPYPVMTPLIKQVLDEAPKEFRENPMIRDFVSAANDNMAQRDYTNY